MSEGFSPRKAEGVLWRVCLYDSYQDLYDHQMGYIAMKRLPERLNTALLEFGGFLKQWGEGFRKQMQNINRTA